MPNLTKTVVDDAQPLPGKAQTFVWDSKLKGFGLRIMANGTKAFILQYRPKDSRQDKRMTLGRYSEALTPDQARKLAVHHFASIVQGKDPLASQQAKKAERTVDAMLDEFVEKHVERNNKASTAYKEKHALNTYVRPVLGKLKLSALTTPAVKRWHTAMDTPVAANRSLAYLRRACRFALEHGWLTVNPCTGITPNKEQAKDRFLTDAELTRIGAALVALEAKGEAEASLALGVRLLALTGLRKGEIRNLRWDDYDPTMGTLRLVDGKTGTRTVALFPEAAELLEGAARIGPYIVAGFDPTKPVSDPYFSRTVAGIMSTAKITDASAHTFRHTAATYMAQHGTDAFAISRLGGWKTLAMVQRYVSMHSVGKPHPLPAGRRIALALAGGNVVPMKAVA